MLIQKSTFLVFIVLLLTTSLSLFAQYGNEWVENIGYDKTFYKFKTNHTGLHRISNQALLDAGITANGAELKVFNRGEEIPIYVTTNGVFTDADYVEFYGETNSGYYDTQLYAEALHQPNPYFSMFEDEGTYFLVQDNNTNGLRFQEADNDLSSFANPNETFTYKSELGAHNTFHFGKPKHAYGSTSSFESSFGVGEGYCTSTISYLSVAGNVYNNKEIKVPTHSVDYSSTELATVTVRIVGKNRNAGVYFDRDFNISINDNIYVHSFGSQAAIINPEKLLHAYETKDYTFNVPLSELNDTTNVFVEVFDGQGTSGFPFETEISVGSVIIKYPRIYDFGGINNLKFNASIEQTEYFEINNFNGGNAPVIYDLTSYERIIPVYSNENYRFKLNPNTNTERTLFISSTEVDNTVYLVDDLMARNYSNFNAVEGDYIIIYNKLLSNTDCGVDQIQRYIDYRSSELGGNYNVAAIEIEDLYDLFAHGIDKHPLSIKHFINFAIDTWNIEPDLVNLIGKGVQANWYRFNSEAEEACLVPSYGNTASDIMLSSRSNTEIIPQLGVGRVPVNNCEELNNYLDKVIEYNDALCAFTNRNWMNNGLFIAKGWSSETYEFLDSLMIHQDIVENNLLDFDVVNTLINDNGNIASQPCGTYEDYFETIYNDQQHVRPRLESGLALIDYIGHSVGEIWQFDIGKPTDYDNEGKYPVIISNSSFVGRINGYNTCDEEFLPSMAEKWTLAEKRGAIAFLGSSTFSAEETLSLFTKELFTILGTIEFRYKPISEAISETILSLSNKIENDIFIDSTARALEVAMHDFIFSGDPALKFHNLNLPDFVVSEENISVLDTTIHPDEESVYVYYDFENTGVEEVYNIIIEVSLVDENENILYTNTYVIQETTFGSYALDMSIPNDAEGNYSFVVTMDATGSFAELCEDNNTASIDIEITSFSDPTPITNFEDETICEGWSSGFNAYPSGGTYNLVSTGEVIFNINSVIKAWDVGEYEISYTYNGDNYVLTDTVTLSILAVPENLSITDPVAICEGDSVELTVTGNNISYVKWIGNGNNEEAESIIVTVADYYSAYVYSEGDCLMTLQTEISYLPPNDCTTPVYEALNTQSIVVYPNPTKSLLNIEFEKPINEVVEVSIYSLDGKKIENVSNTVVKQQVSINVKEFSSGIYWLKAETKNGEIFTGKFIKE